jgi:antitoxin component YwqK of YwqJK toxin-antitoxin module
MKPFLIILISLYTLTAFGQQPEYPDSGFTNKAEAKNMTVNGKKEGKWVEYYDTIHPNVSPSYWLVVYKAGNPYGIVRYFRSSGKLSGEAPYVNGEINGIEKVYFEDGKVMKEIPYVNGKENGLMKMYNANGTLGFEANAINGRECGIEKEYYPSGKLSQEKPVINDTINGVWKEYYESGKLKSETIYTNGVAGPTKNYDTNGIEIKK